MKHNYTSIIAVLTACFLGLSAQAQQLPNASFEDWSGAAFDGNIQPASWNVSNVEQFGFKFNFAHRETGRSGYAVMVQTTSVGAAGINEASPGYFSLGQPWVRVESLTKVNEATAGTYGGVSWTWRPDTMQVWVKRTGSDVSKEDFHLLYYAWSGTAQGTSYMGKNSKCTSCSKTDEESDIRQALDGNECTTSQFGKQIAEGWVRERKEYAEWTCFKVPIYYMNSDVPEKMNIIFSASNYPNFRANSGLYVGNSLYVDDVSLIYSSKIQSLYIGNKKWNGFDPNSSEEQTYSVGNATSIPAVYGMRGEGTLTNLRGTSATFTGRRLTDSEFKITQQGTIDGDPMIIEVKAEDGSSTTTYKIKFISRPSSNARLASIKVNGEAIQGFNGYVTSYNVALPYGTTATPTVEYEKAEEAQTVTFVAPTSPTGTSTIRVTAADGTTVQTYTLNFSIAQLADNTLSGIKVNGEAIPNFNPNQTVYKVELPLSTTTMPTVEAVSAYPAGAQTITYTAPATIDGGQYQIAVSTPGKTTPKVYKLNFKITASTYSYLADLQMEGGYISAFSPDQTTYYVNLPLGTTAMPQITYTAGDAYQTVTMEDGGIDGTTRITVTAAAGNQTIYKIVCTTEKSSNCSLQNIFLDGVAIDGFSSDQTVYTIALPIGTTSLPAITYIQGDAYQTVTVQEGGIDGVTRISVVANDGTTNLYQLRFSVEKSENNQLQMIYLSGQPLEGFDPALLEYNISLAEGTTALPEVTYLAGDAYQTINYRAASSLNGEARIVVKPASGTAATYILHFSVQLNNNTNLSAIYLDGTALDSFDADTETYNITLPQGESTIPTITFDKGDDSQRVLQLTEGYIVTLRVTAASGDTRTYTLQFEVLKSSNAFLQMIYLDGTPLAGFNSETLSGYTVELADVNNIPTITYDKEVGQRVTTVLPIGGGDAILEVCPEEGACNKYVIRFTQSMTSSMQLSNIYLDGVALAGFASNVYTYNVQYEKTLPVITYDAAVGATVSLLYEEDKVIILISDGSNSNSYTLNFTQQLSNNAQLSNILLNGTTLTGFDKNTLEYTYVLSAGTSLPTIEYTKQETLQQVVAGWTDESTYSIQVTAADETTKQTYKVHVQRTADTDSHLENILVEGVSLSFQPNVFTYTVDHTKGATLPLVAYTKKTSQTVVYTQTNDHQQQLLVIAEDGSQSTYTINYVDVVSNVALLDNILLDGTALTGFKKDQFAYVDSLAWRTKVVPVVTPVKGQDGQQIAVYYSAVNGTTRIHVVAEDGVAATDYTIAFPVRRSSNTLLESVTALGVDFDFVSETTLYTLTLPYQTNEAPMLSYEKQEPEQQVEYLAASVNDTSKLTVTAEDGTQRIYRFVFKKTYSDKQNRLQSILVNGAALDLKNLTETDATHFSINVPMAYGSEEFNVSCLKNYDEQSYFVQPGGLLHPTKILLYSNRPGEETVEYTVVPQLDTQNPAVLSSLSVNGTALADFNPNKFTYVVSVPSASIPTITYTAASGVTVTNLGQTTKAWSVKVAANGYENIYTVVIHYAGDVIPNGEFTNWTNAAKRTSAEKPVSWQVAADYADSYGFPTAYTGTEVVQGDGVASFYTKKLSTSLDWGGGGIPAIATLGTLTFTWGVSGSTSSVFSGSIPFQNTPDAVAIRYKHVKNSGSGALFAFRFWATETSGGTATEKEYNMDYLTTETTSDYVVYTHPLPTDGKQIEKMNIAINASNQTSGVKSGTELHVDYLRFIYSSALTGLQVGGEEATLSGNAFSYTLLSSEEYLCPQLSFTGAVSDQAQTVTWSDEVNGVRTATIKNYAEDGTSTDYTLTVTRPFSTINTLKAIQVDGLNIDGWKADTYEYTLQLGKNEALPSITAEAKSHLQTVDMSVSDSEIRYTVTPESGEAKVYTIHIVRTQSSDVTLKSLTAEGVTYNAATTTYEVTAATMPSISFEKQYDAQQVLLHGGVLSVTAEDGTVGKYEIILHQPASTTSGLLTSILADEVELKDYSKTTYRYTGKTPTITSFVREYNTDSIVQRHAGDSIVWEVYGSENHRYLYAFPTTASSEVNLKGITLNGTAYADFLPLQSNYELATDEPINIQFLRADDGQSLSISRDNSNNTISVAVQAEDGTARTEPYTVTLTADDSDDPYLQMIYLDGTPLADFKADVLKYTITLPASDPKTTQPQLPTISYTLRQPKQSVAIETAPLGQVSYLIVTSEDGDQQAQYELTIKAEPSHNASLSGLYVNGQSVTSFQADNYRYSAQVHGANVDLQYSTLDRFQTITTETFTNGSMAVNVTAEDGTTKHSYIVDIYQEALSDNTTLKNILLNGQAFSLFDATSEDFNAKQLRYNISMTTGTKLPDVYVTLDEEGQAWELLQGATVDTIRVTAADGVAKDDYIINFVYQKSDNVVLSNIYVDGVAISNFDQETLEYAISLPVGTTQLPAVDVQKAEATQTTTAQWNDNDYSCLVTAENGATRTYKLHFTVLQSAADTLTMIYADGLPLEAFQPHTYYYAFSLAEGEKQIPQLTVDQADDWQTVTVDTIKALLSTTYQYSVVAQNGLKNVYTVVYTLQQSSDNTLEAIMVNNKLLADFSQDQLEYTYTLSSEETVVPEVTYMQHSGLADLQQVQVVASGDYTRKIIVTAENGNERIYTIYFQRALSNNAYLKAIYYAGQAIANYDEEILTYRIALPYGTQDMPIITFTKNEDAQNVTLSSTDWEAQLQVVAADGTTQTYTITFYVSQSDNAQLTNITLDGEALADFAPTTSEYHISLPYDAGNTLPEIGWSTADEQQKVVMTQTDSYTVVLQVTAGDGETVNEYTLFFTVNPSPINTLADLQVNGTTVENFAADVYEYDFSYPSTATEADFFTVEDIAFTLTDSAATATIVQQDKNTIIITVVAASGDVAAYVLIQTISLPNNAYLQEILVDGKLLADFVPDQFEYEYLLLEGSILPVLTATAQDTAAEVNITTSDIGEKSYIYCTAPDGTEYEYTVLFRYSDLNTGKTATENDVIFKHIPGTNQYIAATIRQNIKVAIYDAYGHRLQVTDVPVCDPNVVDVVTDDKGLDLFADTDSYTDGAIITIEYTNKPFFYVFFQNEKKRIASGKVLLRD